MRLKNKTLLGKTYPICKIIIFIQKPLNEIKLLASRIGILYRVIRTLPDGYEASWKSELQFQNIICLTQNFPDPLHLNFQTP